MCGRHMEATHPGTRFASALQTTRFERVRRVVSFPSPSPTKRNEPRRARCCCLTLSAVCCPPARSSLLSAVRLLPAGSLLLSAVCLSPARSSLLSAVRLLPARSPLLKALPASHTAPTTQAHAALVEVGSSPRHRIVTVSSSPYRHFVTVSSPRVFGRPSSGTESFSSRTDDARSSSSEETLVSPLRHLASPPPRAPPSAAPRCVPRCACLVRVFASCCVVSCCACLVLGSLVGARARAVTVTTTSNARITALHS